jgi:hypothetical protein
MWKILLIYVVCASILSGCNPFEDKLVILCENELKNRLKSPSSYTRVSAEFSQTSIPIPEWKDILITQASGKYGGGRKLTLQSNLRYIEEHAEDIKSGKYPSPTRFNIHFQYDAQNGFGAMIRGGSLCEFVSSNDSNSEAAYYNVKVDGFDHSEYLIESIKQSQ